LCNGTVGASITVKVDPFLRFLNLGKLILLFEER